MVQITVRALFLISLLICLSIPLVLVLNDSAELQCGPGCCHFNLRPCAQLSLPVSFYFTAQPWVHLPDLLGDFSAADVGVRCTNKKPTHHHERISTRETCLPITNRQRRHGDLLDLLIFCFVFLTSLCV